MPQGVVDLLRVTDDAINIIYHLGKNPQIARDIAAAYAAGDRQTVANALDYVSNGLRFSQQHAQQPQRPQTMNLEPLLPTSAPLPDVRKV